MMSLGRRLLLVLIMLWLPLQGAMAASMSLCAKEKVSSAKPDKPAATAADQHHHVSHEHSMQDVTDEVTSNLQCNGGPCQASCSAPIPSAASAAIFYGTSAYTLSFTSRFTSLVPEQLQRPTLA